MLLFTCFQNIDNTIHDAIKPTSSNMHWTPQTTLLSILFKLDPPPSSLSSSFNRSDLSSPNSKKTDKKPVDKLL